MMHHTIRLTALLALAGCAAPAAGPEAPAQQTTAAEAGVTRPQEADAGLVPAGHGTLMQDEVTLALRSGPLLVKATPLSEEVTRLLAPDTYKKLHALAASRAAEAARAAGSGEPEILLVSFFSYEPDVEFQPESLELSAQGQMLRPAAILPVTPGWGRQRLSQQETQTALYVFREPIDYDLPIAVHYGLERNDDWSRIIQRLEVERAKVRARAGS